MSDLIVDPAKVTKLVLIKPIRVIDNTAMLKLLDEVRRDVENGLVTTLAIAAGHATGESMSALSWNSEGNMGVLLGAIVRLEHQAIEAQPTRRA